MIQVSSKAAYSETYFDSKVRSEFRKGIDLTFTRDNSSTVTISSNEIPDTLLKGAVERVAKLRSLRSQGIYVKKLSPVQEKIAAVLRPLFADYACEDVIRVIALISEEAGMDDERDLLLETVKKIEAL